MFYYLRINYKHIINYTQEVKYNCLTEVKNNCLEYILGCKGEMGLIHAYLHKNLFTLLHLFSLGM